MGTFLGICLYISIGVLIGLLLGGLFGIGERCDMADIPEDMPETPGNKKVFQRFNPLD